MRPALGKGLDALISQDTVASVAAAQTKGGTIPLDKIRANPKQPRKDFSEPSLAALTESIRQNGVLQPIVVSPVEGGYEIIAGERRWRASQRAGLKEIPAVIRQGSEAERFEISLIENLQREDLNPIELALGYQRLQDEFHMTQEAIARVVGKDRTVVANTLRLLTLSDPIRQALQSGSLTAGHAKALLSIEDPVARDVLYQQITSDNLTVRAVESVARSKKKIISQHAAATGYETRSPEVRALEEELQRVLGRKVEIHGGQAPSHKGSLKLEYYSLDDFDTLIQRLRETPQGNTQQTAQGNAQP